MADADPEQPPAPEMMTEGGPPGGAEPPPPGMQMEKPMEMADGSEMSYWKTYPGIWKLLQLVFGSIAAICIIICLTPEWTFASNGLCPPHLVLTATNRRLAAAYGYDLYYGGEFDKKDTRYDGHKDHKYSKKELEYITTTYFKDFGPTATFLFVGLGGDPPGSLNNPYGPNGIENPYNSSGYGQQCYGSLTTPDWTWGFTAGRHDVWLYCWTFILFSTLIVNITILVLQYKNPNFVFAKKTLLMFYYGFVWLFIDFPAVAMLVHCAENMAHLHITLPRAVPCMVGAVFTVFNAICHAHSFHWNYIHKAP